MHSLWLQGQIHLHIHLEEMLLLLKPINSSLYGVYDDEELLGNAMQELFGKNYQLINPENHMDLVSKYAPSEVLEWILKEEKYFPELPEREK